MVNNAILAVDQGTTSSRAIVFDGHSGIVSVAQQEIPQYYPHEGWVEHDLEAIWQSVKCTAQQAFIEAQARGVQVQALAITNQRETVALWDKSTGEPLHNAIVWQDRRTSSHCERLRQSGCEPMVRGKTGLLLDPYFSATKIAWLLDSLPGARAKAEAGKLAFGTIDSFLLSRLTGLKVHATDATNASRTSLFNIHKQAWDEELLKLFTIPEALLPEVRDSADDYGNTTADLFGREIPIVAVAGDQQAAAIGQCCVSAGAIKSTYGTGAFVLMNTGESVIDSQHKLLSTVAYRLRGKTSYALEGSIFIAGSAVQWLRDRLKLLSDATESEAIARGLRDNGGVYMVPAFTGLGAPYWNPQARGVINGLSLSCGSEHIVRAALESVCYQSHDLFKAFADDGVKPSLLRVDGGMAANSWLMQFLADTLNLKVERPVVRETTALGASYLAALQLGWVGSLAELSQQWQLDASFVPKMPEHERQKLLAAWTKIVQQANDV